MDEHKRKMMKEAIMKSEVDEEMRAL